ncbi:MAG: hypothetical protein R3A45_00140 [Bdellovibrionota bacterium]
MHTRKLINKYLSRGEFSQAGDTMLAMGKHQLAIDIFKKAVYSRAADVLPQTKITSKKL